MSVINNKLLIDGCCPDFFNSYSWYSNFVENVVRQDNCEYCFLTEMHHEANDYSILPVMVIGGAQGLSIKSMTNYYSPLYKILKHGGSVVNIAELISNNFPQWSTITLDSMDDDECKKITSSINFYKNPWIKYDHFANWYLPVSGRSYDEYFASLAPRVRNTVERKAKSFGKLKNTRLTIFSDSEDIEIANNAFQYVYNKSWKRPEPYPKFIPELIKIAAQHDSLRMGVAYLDGVPIACQLWIVADGAAYIYKLAYDEEHKKYSAGTILTAYLMRHVIDKDRVKVVDFLSGDDAYKKEWMSHRRMRVAICIYNPLTFSGFRRMCFGLAKSIMKKMIRK